MADSPLKNITEEPRLQVYCSGTAIPSTINVLSVVITESLDEGSTATFVIPDGDSVSGDFPISDTELLNPGKVISVEAGYGNAAVMVFEGVIDRHGISISDSGSFLKLECKGEGSPRNLGHTGKAVLSLTYGLDILEFNADSGEGIRAAGSRIEGSVRFPGSALARPGSWIELHSVGKRFYGNVFVTQVTHLIKNGEWATEVRFVSGF